MTTASARFASTLSPFVPRPGLGNGHVMTVYAWARRRAFPALPPPEARLFRVAEDSQVLADCYWQANRRNSPTLVALHGLEGSSASHYMRGLADKAWRRGWNAVLLNQRNCGGTEHLTPGLYHSGLTADPHAILRTLAEEDGLSPIGLVGYSLGGNLAVKLAGELGASADLPLVGAAAVSPTIDLDACVRAIERPFNVVYQWNFVRNLKDRLRRKALVWPKTFDLGPLARISTIREFDDVYTAPLQGFEGAADYYYRASAIRVADRVRLPTLIISAHDDPFVPEAQFRGNAVAGNASIAVRLERHGGHCAFVGRGNVADDGYWAERSAVDFIASLMPR
jgi:uncharacterized protein